MEELKEFIDDLKKEIGHVRNDVAAKFANDQLNAPASPKKEATSGGVKAGGGTGVSLDKIKAIESDIK